MTLNSYWSAYSDSEQTFSDTSYAEKHTLDFTAPAQGDYLIIVSFLLSVNSTSYQVHARVQLDNLTTIMEGNHEPNNAGVAFDYRNYSTIYLAEDLASGAHYIDIDAYIQPDNGQTGYIKYAKIIVLRLDDALGTSGMYAYANTETEKSFTDWVWETCETLTFTPDQAGDYLVLASMEVKCYLTSTSLHARLNYDSASEYLPLKNTEESGDSWCTYEAKNALDYYPWVWGGIISIPASEKTILLEGLVNSLTSSKVRKRRIFAIRLGAIGTVESDEDATVTTSKVMVTKASLSWTPSNAVDHLILGGIVVKPDASNEEAQIVIDQANPTSDVIQHSYCDSKDYAGDADCIPYFSGKIGTLGDTLTHVFRVRYGGRTTSDDVYAKACWVVAIEIESTAPPPEYNVLEGKLINRKINSYINERIN